MNIYIRSYASIKVSIYSLILLLCILTGQSLMTFLYAGHFCKSVIFLGVSLYLFDFPAHLSVVTPQVIWSNRWATCWGFERGDAVSSGVTNMPGKALSLSSLILPRHAYVDSNAGHNWTWEKVKATSAPCIPAPCTSGKASAVHGGFLTSPCSPWIQPKLFSVFQEIFNMSELLMAFFYNIPLDLFTRSFLWLLILGLNQEGGCVRLVGNLYFFLFRCSQFC